MSSFFYFTSYFFFLLLFSLFLLTIYYLYSFLSLNKNYFYNQLIINVISLSYLLLLKLFSFNTKKNCFLFFYIEKSILLDYNNHR